MHPVATGLAGWKQNGAVMPNIGRTWQVGFVAVGRRVRPTDLHGLTRPYGEAWMSGARRFAAYRRTS
jgi:hypothetical protein